MLIFFQMHYMSDYYNHRLFLAAEAETARQKSSSYEMLDAERETAIHQDMALPSGAVYSGLGK